MSITESYVLNTVTKAFYTWTIEPVINKLRSVIYVQDAQRLNEPKIKYLTTVEISTTQEVIFFAEAKDNIFLDWTILGTYYSSPNCNSRLLKLLYHWL